MDGVEEILEGLRKEIADSPFQSGDEEIEMSISVGVSWQTAENLEGLIKAADNCLYEAKRGGRNKVVVEQPRH
jgi:diguanylate cyclase (GGDEF)-like protein